MPIDPLPVGATLRRFAYPTRGVTRVVEDAPGAASDRHYLQLDELQGSGDWRDIDRVPLLQGFGEAPRRHFVFESPDFLTHGDGDGVADANERLEGTDPADPGPMPGHVTLDEVALNDASLQRDVDALRQRGVAVTSAASTDRTTISPPPCRTATLGESTGLPAAAMHRRTAVRKRTIRTPTPRRALPMRAFRSSFGTGTASPSPR